MNVLFFSYLTIVICVILYIAFQMWKSKDKDDDSDQVEPDENGFYPDEQEFFADKTRVF